MFSGAVLRTHSRTVHEGRPARSSRPWCLAQLIIIVHCTKSWSTGYKTPANCDFTVHIFFSFFGHILFILVTSSSSKQVTLTQFCAPLKTVLLCALCRLCRAYETL